MRKKIRPGEMITSVTIRLESYLADGSSDATGTGFFYSVSMSEEDFRPVIITNKHVLEDADAVKLCFTQSDEYGNRLKSIKDFTMKIWPGARLDHPDPDVDLCALDISQALSDLRAEGFNIYTHYLSKAIVAGDERMLELDAIEDVLIIGYPSGFWDSHHNLPIARRGITATDPKYDYEGKKEFLVDATVVPGSSGSPIFWKNAKGHHYLIGVLHSACLTWEHIEDADPGAGEQLDMVSKMYINLGIAVKGIRLLELDRLIEQQQTISM